MGLRVFDQNDGISRCIRGLVCTGCYLILRINAERDIRCDGISIRCDCLTQNILFVHQQALDHVGFFCRCPLLDKDEFLLFVRIFCVLVCQFLCCRFAQHLDLSAFQFFAVRNIRLLHMDMRQFICHIAGQCCQRIISTQRQFTGC